MFLCRVLSYHVILFYNEVVKLVLFLFPFSIDAVTIKYFVGTNDGHILS